MNKTIHHLCVLLIFIFNQGSISDSAPLPDGNQLENWKNNALVNLNRTSTCLDNHYKEVFGLDYDERFFGITVNELRACSGGDDSIIRESSINFEANSKHCPAVLLKLFERKITAITKIDLEFVARSREELNTCFRNGWHDWKVSMFELTKKLEPCVKANRKGTSRESYDSRSKPAKNFCVIENGVLSE